MKKYSICRSGRFIATIILCVLASSNCFAQLDRASTLGQVVIHKIQQLRDDRIDTIIAYHTECDGCFTRKGKDSCVAGYRFLIWCKKNKAFGCILDNCGEHRTIQMSLNSFSLITSAFLKIDKLKNKYDIQADSASRRDSTMAFIAGDDIPQDIFDFYFKGRRVSIVTDEGAFASTMTNLYDKRILKLLKLMTDAVINEASHYSK